MVNPWYCATLISVSGAAGGVVNALLTDNGFILPTRVKQIWCPGFISNVLIGTFSAFASWSFYGSGAGLDVSGAGQRTQISLTFSALAGAFMVGVAGARWITNEVDKKLLGKVCGWRPKKTFQQLTATNSATPHLSRYCRRSCKHRQGLIETSLYLSQAKFRWWGSNPPASQKRDLGHPDLFLGERPRLPAIRKCLSSEKFRSQRHINGLRIVVISFGRL